MACVCGVGGAWLAVVGLSCLLACCLLGRGRVCVVFSGLRDGLELLSVAGRSNTMDWKPGSVVIGERECFAFIGLQSL